MASSEFQNNKEVVIIAFSQLSSSLKFASISLNNKLWFSEYLSKKENKEIFDKCISINGLMLKYANEEYRDDKEVVFQAIKQNGNAYQFASDRLK